MTDNDDEVWQTVIRDIVPMPQDKVALEGKPKKISRTEKFETVAYQHYAHEPALNATADIDRQTMRRFKRGDYKIEAVLDLHNKTENNAFELVRRFVTESYLSGKRCVLIITGKGLHQEDEYVARGRLKARVPQWLTLDELRPLILTYVHPQERLGGEGALMILLRRKRT